MAEKKTEKKAKGEKLERIYTIPLRKEWIKSPRHKRAKKTVRAIKEFMVRHMRIYDKDLDKIKIDPWVNRAIWSRGIKNVPHKMIVKAVKEGDEVYVSFIGLPRNFKEEESFLKKRMEKVKKRESETKKQIEEKKKAAEKAVEAAKKKEEQKTEEEKLEEQKKKEQEKELHKEIKQEHQHAGHEVKSPVKTTVHKTNTKK